MAIKEQIQQKLFDDDSNTLLVHSDLMQGFEIPFKGRESFVISHTEELLSLKKDLNVWMPAFNYDFCKGIEFDVKNTPSIVGPLTEYFRKNTADWRTSIPVFSFSGIGENPNLDFTNIIDPFGAKSAFHWLYEHNASLMHYGSSLHSSTILHYAERMSNRLFYRYDKLFKGKIVQKDASSIDCEFNFHVRPMGKHLDYNWAKIESDLFDNNIVTQYQGGRTRILLCKIKELVDFWISQINQNPLYLLDSESLLWVEPMIEKLGSPFLQSDFEIMK